MLSPFEHDLSRPFDGPPRPRLGSGRRAVDSTYSIAPKKDKERYPVPPAPGPSEPPRERRLIELSDAPSPRLAARSLRKSLPVRPRKFLDWNWLSSTGGVMNPYDTISGPSTPINPFDNYGEEPKPATCPPCPPCGIGEPKLMAIEDLEIFATGQYRGQSYDHAFLDSVDTNFDTLSKGESPKLTNPVVVGHEEDQEWLENTGLPACGRAADLWITKRDCPTCNKTGQITGTLPGDPSKMGDAPCPTCFGTKQQGVLHAKLADVPVVVAKVIKQKAYNTVSSEMYDDYEDQGKKYGPTLRRIALLGGELPQVKSLQEITKLAAFGETKQKTTVVSFTAISPKPKPFGVFQGPDGKWYWPRVHKFCEGDCKCGGKCSVEKFAWRAFRTRVGTTGAVNEKGVRIYGKAAQEALSSKPRESAAPAAKPESSGGTSRASHLAKQVNDLYNVVHKPEVGFGAIDEVADAVGRLSRGEARQVASGFGIRTTASASKQSIVDAVKRKLTEQKGSAQRIAPIAGAIINDMPKPASAAKVADIYRGAGFASQSKLAGELEILKSMPRDALVSAIQQMGKKVRPGESAEGMRRQIRQLVLDRSGTVERINQIDVLGTGKPAAAKVKPATKAPASAAIKATLALDQRAADDRGLSYQDIEAHRATLHTLSKQDLATIRQKMGFTVHPRDTAEYARESIITAIKNRKSARERTGRADEVVVPWQAQTTPASAKTKAPAPPRAKTVKPANVSIRAASDKVAAINVKVTEAKAKLSTLKAELKTAKVDLAKLRADLKKPSTPKVATAEQTASIDELGRLYDNARSESVTRGQILTALERLEKAKPSLATLRLLAPKLSVPPRFPKTQLWQQIRESILKRKGLAERVKV